MAQQEFKTASPEDFELYDNTAWTISNNIAVSKSGANCAALGSKQISQGIHHWLVLFEGRVDCCCDFGIASNSISRNILKGNLNKKCNNYPVMVSYHCTDANGCVYYNFGQKRIGQKINKVLKSGDKIRIVVDYPNQTVTFYHNEALAFTKNNLPIGADKKYRLLIDGDTGSTNKFTILKSERKSPTILISLKSIIANVNKMSEELKRFNKNAVCKMSVKDLASMKQETVEFEQECKEFEQCYEAFKTEVKQFAFMLDNEMNPDTNDFKQWKSAQICRYVLSLDNQRFSNYMDAFSKAIEAQDIKGGDLPDITPNDLLTMGVNVFRDRKDLAKYFQTLAANEGNAFDLIKNEGNATYI